MYDQIEERHFGGDSVTIVNFMTVFEFDEQGKICRLTVYLRQPREMNRGATGAPSAG